MIFRKEKEESFFKKMSKLILKETEEIIRNIKKEQKDVLKQWAEEEGVTL